MTDIARLLDANKDHVAARADVTDPMPARRLALITCMDARIDALAALGLELGDAIVLRNAGARITDDVLRSLALATHKLGVETVVVMQHTQCGAWGVTDDGLRTLTGADLDFFPIDDHASAMRADVELLATRPYLDHVKEIAGFLYDVGSGEVDEVVHWERP
jgi:carbonic anhydrase